MDTTRRAFLIGGGAAVVLAACGSDGDDASTAPTSPPDTSSTEGSVVLPEPTTTNGLDGELPPVEATDLEPLLGPRLAELGLVLTNRGGLIDTRNGQYLQSPNGNHVALYVEPVGDYTNDQFIDGIYEVTLLSAPTIFERWPAIESYDICQEPRAEDDPATRPGPGHADLHDQRAEPGDRLGHGDDRRPHRRNARHPADRRPADREPGHSGRAPVCPDVRGSKGPGGRGLSHPATRASEASRGWRR